MPKVFIGGDSWGSGPETQKEHRLVALAAIASVFPMMAEVIAKD
jgi:hypothetical protein